MAKELRLSPNSLAAEKSNFENLKNIGAYSTLNPEFSISAIQAIVDDLEVALAEEARLRARMAEVRDIIAAKGTALKTRNDGAVQQVVAQFGDDSPEYQSLGRRRRSDRRTGLVRQAKPKLQQVT